MDKDFLKDEANALLVQKHQLNQAENKLAQINKTLDKIEAEQDASSKALDDLLANAQALLENVDTSCICKEEEQRAFDDLNKELSSLPSKTNSIALVDELEVLEFDENMDFQTYIKSCETYAKKNHIDLSQDPFKNLMSNAEQIELQKRIKEEFSLKNAKCDQYDYLIAGTCGAIAGIIDIVFVGKPGESILGDKVDEFANTATEKFAELCGWNRTKAEERGSNTTKSAIGYLENGRKKNNFKGFKVNYDQTSTNGRNGTGGQVPDLSTKNHHLKSMGHSPDLLGLFVSILNQFTNTSTFLSNGQLITIDTENYELQGGNFIAKIFCGFANWFGHLASDWNGSSGAEGRGSGIPIPFYNLFQLCDFGRFEGQKTFAIITSEVFEKGYDLRHGLTMTIPVTINELLIRFMYVMKARFYHHKEWAECLPRACVPELRRMLCVGYVTLCLIDGVDAAVRSGGAMANPVEFLLRTNLIAWVRFGQFALKELNAWWNEGKIDDEALDEYLDKDLQRMLKSSKLR